MAQTRRVMKMPKRERAGMGDQALVTKAAAVVKEVMKVALAEFEYVCDCIIKVKRKKE